MSSPDARMTAQSVGAADLFVLRRVSPGRFVHLGGAGRGEGWAGIVDATLEDEADLARALSTEEIVRLESSGRDLVFGPYYARGAAIVPVRSDVLVVFGAADGAITAADHSLAAAAQTVLDVVGPAGPAKELADRLEVLEAVQAVSAVSPTPVDRAMEAIAGIAAGVLSCEVGIMYIADGDRIAVAERGWSLETEADELRSALAPLAEGNDFPFCVQDARRSPLPGALADEAGIRSYYLLELTGTANGVLLVAHTEAAPRGFTLLCRRVGMRVAEVASDVIGTGLTLEWTSEEADLIQSAFAVLEG